MQTLKLQLCSSRVEQTVYFYILDLLLFDMFNLHFNKTQNVTPIFSIETGIIRLVLNTKSDSVKRSDLKKCSDISESMTNK